MSMLKIIRQHDNDILSWIVNLFCIIHTMVKLSFKKRYSKVYQWKYQATSVKKGHFSNNSCLFFNLKHYV